MEISNKEWYKNYCKISPMKLNTLEDKESRKKDRSEWKLNSRKFPKLCYERGCPEIDQCLPPVWQLSSKCTSLEGKIT